MRCQGCGATFEPPPGKTITECPFCGAKEIHDDGVIEMQAPEPGKPMGLTCTNCAGELDVTDDDELFKCPYCETLVLIRRHRDRAEASVASLDKITEVTFAANMKRPVLGFMPNWQGGKVHITEQEVVFVPHKFNFGTFKKCVVQIPDITEMKKSGINTLRIFTSDDDPMFIRVWDRDKVMDAVNRHR